MLWVLKRCWYNWQNATSCLARYFSNLMVALCLNTDEFCCRKSKRCALRSKILKHWKSWATSWKRITWKRRKHCRKTSVCPLYFSRMGSVALISIISPLFRTEGCSNPRTCAKGRNPRRSLPGPRKHHKPIQGPRHAIAKVSSLIFYLYTTLTKLSGILVNWTLFVHKHKQRRTSRLLLLLRLQRWCPWISNCNPPLPRTKRRTSSLKSRNWKLEKPGSFWGSFR